MSLCAQCKVRAGTSLQGWDTIQGNWIDGLIFTRSEDEIRCEIERMDGFHGTILARRIEVLAVEPDVPSPPCP